jgi:hypothetical protein
VIDVQPLPDGAPAGFGGAVGSFQISASLAAASLQAGDGTQIIVIVRGKGSFESVVAPSLRMPEGLKVFEPEIVETIDFEADGQLAGRKTFTFPILATRSGHHEIPAIEWAFLDPGSRRYVERRTEPLVLEAAGGGPDIVAALPAAPVDPFELEGSDLRHVRASLPLWRPDLAARGVPAWIVAVAIAGPLANLALLAWSMLARLRTTDPALRRALAAPGLARRRLAEATDALHRGRTVEAADGAARAIAGLVADRLGLGAALAPAEAAAALVAAGEVELAEKVERFLSACDLARFASGSEADTRRILSDAEKILSPLTRLKVAAPPTSDRSA